MGSPTCHSSAPRSGDRDLFRVLPFFRASVHSLPRRTISILCGGRSAAAHLPGTFCAKVARVFTLGISPAGTSRIRSQRLGNDRTVEARQLSSSHTSSSRTGNRAEEGFVMVSLVALVPLLLLVIVTIAAVQLALKENFRRRLFVWVKV